MILNRRHLVLSGLAGTGIALAPRIAFAAAETDRRFIFIIQRGAADGLAILAPTGDPAFAAARGEIAASAASGTALDSLFTLHPEMKASATLFGQKQAAFVHAIASGYRERSHFDGQNMLETAGTRPYGRDDGWMNRLLTLLPTTPMPRCSNGSPCFMPRTASWRHYGKARLRPKPWQWAATRQDAAAQRPESWSPA